MFFVLTLCFGYFWYLVIERTQLWIKNANVNVPERAGNDSSISIKKRVGTLNIIIYYWIIYSYKFYDSM